MIRLRDYYKDDRDRLVELANNQNVSEYLIDLFPYPYTQKDAEQWIASGSKLGGAINKIIEYQGEFVGGIGITPQNGWKSHTAEIGYWLGETYWGKGIAASAVGLMVEQTFRNSPVIKLFAQVLSPNNASRRVLEKCGFTLEGMLAREVFKNGRYFDVYHYGKYSDYSVRSD